MLNLRKAAIVAATVGVIPAFSYAMIPTVIFSNIQSSITSDVPGNPGLKFKAGTGTASAFDRPFVSADGTRWVLGGFVGTGTTDDDVIISGTGTTSTGSSIVIRAGNPTPWNPNVNYNIINTHMGINNSGDIAYSGTTTATSSQYIGFASGGTVTQIATQGGLTPIAGKTWTATLNSANITNGAIVGYQGSTTPTPTDYLGIVGATTVVQSGVTIPSGQLDAGSRTVAVLTSNSFRVDAAGVNTMYRTTLTGGTAGTNTIVAVNNTVVAQLGLPVPGWSNTANVVSIASEASGLQLSPLNGHWAMRGAVNDGTGANNQTDFVLKNGVVIAATDQPILSTATELFDDTPFAQTFFMNTVNNLGDYVIGGTTNNSDLLRNAVLVFNNQMVIAREFDPVDLDGNGIFDDNVFIDTFGNDDGVLTDNLDFYFVASLRDASGTAVGNAFIHIAIPEPSTLSLIALAGVGLLARRRRD